ncbi:DoxX family protein [Pseudoalteromonas piscicida]|uniref:DoxX family protein n=1 Tax=Pseudoalteromonas piscicida TaxID=43662 RepID=UPI003C7AC6F0
MVTPIIIILLLCGPLLFGVIYSKIRDVQVEITTLACRGLGIAFMFFFIGHIVKAQGMVEMLPSWVPYRLPLVYFTGVIELVVAILLFIPKYQLPAAKAAIAIFMLFFPANVYAALNSVGLGGHQWGPVYLLIRAPLQIILIAWAYFMCVKPLSMPVAEIK